MANCAAGEQHPDGLADGQLMQGLALGDETAVRELYRRFGPAIYGLSRRMLSDHHLAEEATQQTFVQAYRGADRFDSNKGTLAAWIYQVCRRVCIDVYRRERRHRGGLSLDDLEARELSVVPPSIEDSWQRWQIEEAVGSLPEHQRQVINLCSFQRYTHAEAAEQLGVPVGTVKSRLFKAYRALGEMLAHVMEAPDAV
jgi:RNA polymerase sigma factor (sigma-70 family)